MSSSTEEHYLVVLLLQSSLVIYTVNINNNEIVNKQDSVCFDQSRKNVSTAISG